MQQTGGTSAMILGASIILGLALLGLILGHAAIEVKEYERTVTVKGLSERDYEADIVIWPIRFTAAGNDLGALYDTIEDHTAEIRRFLEQSGISPADVSAATPAIGPSTFTSPEVVVRTTRVVGGTDAW